MVSRRGQFYSLLIITILPGFSYFEKNAIDSLSHPQQHVWIPFGKLNQEQFQHACNFQSKIADNTKPQPIVSQGLGIKHSLIN